MFDDDEDLEDPGCIVPLVMIVMFLLAMLMSGLSHEKPAELPVEVDSAAQ